MNQSLLEVRGLRKFSHNPGLPAARRRPCPGRRRRQLYRQRGRDAGPRRRERLRQDYRVALHPARHRPDRRRNPLPHPRRPRGDIAALPPAELRQLRPGVQMIFQDPFGSLNPRMTLLDNVGEPLLVNGIGNRRERTERVAELLRLVGLRPEFLHRFPHAFSGGQRQRIGIARALATAPRLLVADEPVSALDVSVQAQVLNLLLELQSRLRLTFLFVAHDLSVVRHISDRIAVMMSASSSSLLRPTRSSASHSTPTPRPSCVPSRSPTRGCAPPTASWAAKCPVPPRRRQAVTSIHAAATPSPAAAPRRRRFAKYRPATSPVATSPARWRSKGPFGKSRFKLKAVVWSSG